MCLKVIRISQGVTCKGALLRDVGTYAASVMGVGLCFYSGVVSAATLPCMLLSGVVGTAAWPCMLRI